VPVVASRDCRAIFRRLFLPAKDSNSFPELPKCLFTIQSLPTFVYLPSRWRPLFFGPLGRRTSYITVLIRTPSESGSPPVIIFPPLSLAFDFDISGLVSRVTPSRVYTNMIGLPRRSEFASTYLRLTSRTGAALRFCQSNCGSFI